MSQPPAVIRRLPSAVADGIAAGEVVERPASVVKELIENSIDSGASRIDVEIEGGGLIRIRVNDDGDGIAAEEMTLAVERHATSKITSIEDLAVVRSLGFRGEALASIGAVAEVTLVSCHGAEMRASLLTVRAGEVVEQAVAARSRGTTVEVCDLFVATPARLRFLKSARAEAAACSRTLADLVLCHPEVAFSCQIDGRTTLRHPGGTLPEAMSAVFGQALLAELLAVDSDDDGIHVSGSIGTPSAHRGNRNALVHVINGRPVHNRMLSVAVEEAYRGLLPVGRFPLGVIHLEMDSAEVDVNVHPAKREVRFREEGRVFSALQRACWHALQQSPAPQAAFGWSAQGPRLGASRPSLAERLPWTREPYGGQRATDSAAPVLGLEGALQAEHRPTIGRLGELRALGQAGGEWLLASAPGRVLIVDPHAAHEKVIYEGILERWQQSRFQPNSSDHEQLLLLPAILECDAARMERYSSNAELIAACGFQIEHFGPTTLRCTAVPAACAGADVDRLVGELLDTVGEPADDSGRRHRMAALIACHAAVRFGDSLGEAEQQRLLDQLGGIDNATTCPHGRPTVMVLEEAELRRIFKRPSG